MPFGSGETAPLPPETRPILRQLKPNPGLPIKAAAIAGNNRPIDRPPSATFMMAQALVNCSLPHREQTRICLQIIHRMILFWPCCIR